MSQIAKEYSEDELSKELEHLRGRGVDTFLITTLLSSGIHDVMRLIREIKKLIEGKQTLPELVIQTNVFQNLLRELNDVIVFFRKNERDFNLNFERYNYVIVKKENKYYVFKKEKEYTEYDEEEYYTLEPLRDIFDVVDFLWYTYNLLLRMRTYITKKAYNSLIKLIVMSSKITVDKIESIIDNDVFDVSLEILKHNKEAILLHIGKKIIETKDKDMKKRLVYAYVIIDKFLINLIDVTWLWYEDEYLVEEHGWSPSDFKLREISIGKDKTKSLVYLSTKFQLPNTYYVDIEYRINIPMDKKLFIYIDGEARKLFPNIFENE